MLAPRFTHVDAYNGTQFVVCYVPEQQRWGLVWKATSMSFPACYYFQEDAEAREMMARMAVNLKTLSGERE